MSARETEFQRLRRERAEARQGEVADEKPRRLSLPKDVMKERQAERNRRSMEARRRANAVLQARHAKEFEALLADEKIALDEERGPLPGDDMVPGVTEHG